MTAPRQERNGWRPGTAFIALLAGVLGLGLQETNLPWIDVGALVFLPSAAEASTTEHVVVNRFSGLAIDGFDPVAYFTDARAELGREEFEFSEAGAVWRFRNEGNRASFVAHPEIYGPQFGGYDPVDLARGATVAGSPRLWLVSGQRLYLFNREETRDAFAAGPARALRHANLRWPELRQSLAQ